MKKYLLLFVCMLFIFSRFSLWATDFGLLLDQTAGYGGSGGNSDYDYSGSLVPRFSTSLNATSDIYISASAKAEIKNGETTFIPELLRTEFTYKFNSGEFVIGRMRYNDPLGFIASGLFDGANVSFDVGGGSLSAGTWYTGLLYKERANITMTPADAEAFNTPFDFKDFSGTYFAPRRVLSSVGWEHQGLAEIVQIKFAVINQLDLAKDDGLNSQYAAVKISAPASLFVFNLGGCVELIEYNDDFKIAPAGELGVSLMLPAARLSLSGRYSGASAESGSLTAFAPLTTVYQGDILKAKFSGLTIISLDYLGRLHRTFSAGLTALCFIRNDLISYNGYPAALDTSENKILGTELFGRIWWSPVSDILINFGGGAFLPSLGNAAKDADSIWRAEINIILSLY